MPSSLALLGEKKFGHRKKLAWRTKFWNTKFSHDPVSDKTPKFGSFLFVVFSPLPYFLCTRRKWHEITKYQLAKIYGDFCLLGERKSESTPLP